VGALAAEFGVRRSDAGDLSTEFQENRTGTGSILTWVAGIPSIDTVVSINPRAM